VHSLEAARVHVRDLHREAERSQDRVDARRTTRSPLRRLVRRARNA
jgi:hypothetical protein